jgi:hypothetical protein
MFRSLLSAMPGFDVTTVAGHPKRGVEVVLGVQREDAGGPYDEMADIRTVVADGDRVQHVPALTKPRQPG